MGKRKRQNNSGKLQNALKVNCDQPSPNKKIKPIASPLDKKNYKLIPVDEVCLTKVKNVHVYCENDDIYNAMLNQTNVQYNNNKYYLLQLLEDDCEEEYFVWFRWGRVGKKGQSSLQSFKSNLSAAKDCFTEKFHDKTKNTWDTRKDFIKVPGKYDLLQMDYNDDNDDNSRSKIEEAKKIKPKPNLPKSKLKKKLQDLMKLIFDIEAMEKSVKEMNYDANKTPLGKLTKEQISFGFLALKKIEEYINNNHVNSSEFIEACNEFYTRIPHDFGMKRPPLIKTAIQLKEKLNLIETLQGIEVAMNLMNNPLKNLNPIDYHYQMLECGLEPLKASDKDYKMIDLYLQNTHGDTHKHYSLKIVDIFKCYKEKENKNFINYGNRMLLWHGSRLSNWPGILKQGLRIAPPEAPVTGYMFGKGVYFADMCSKSANYCYATDEGLLLLCEVALGNQNKLINANYDANKLPKNKHSVMGLGRTVPNPDEDIVLPDGVKVTVGKPSELKTSDNRSLMYNEYIIYNTRQIKMRYLVRVKFNFNN